MKYLILQNQETIFIISKSVSDYPNIKAQTSDETIPLENYEKRSVVFDDLLLSKEANNNDLFFTRRRLNNIDIYYMSQNFFHLPKTYYS